MNEGAELRRVVLERQPNGGWMLERGRSATAERFPVRSIAEAFAVVFQAYDEDGRPRPWPRADVPCVVAIGGELYAFTKLPRVDA